MVTEKTDREEIQAKMAALDAQITTLEGIKFTVAENPAQTVNMDGIDYTFENQLEVDRVLYPKVEKFNFLSDIVELADDA